MDIYNFTCKIAYLAKQLDDADEVAARSKECSNDLQTLKIMLLAGYGTSRAGIYWGTASL